MTANASARPAEPPLMAALGLLSAATTAHQIALMQVLGWMHWHHFAYMVVAVALLGFGIAGTMLSLARDWFLTHGPRVFPWLLVVAAVTGPVGVRLAQWEVVAVDLQLVFAEPAGAWRMAALCLLLLPPFLAAGLGTGLLLMTFAHHAGRYYAASLGGAGLGGIVGLALAANVAPPRLPSLVALLALGGFACLWSRTRGGARLAASLAVVFIAALLWRPGELRSSQFKPLQRTLDLPDARIIAQRPGLHGWVQVVDAPALRPAPAVSLQFQGEVPAQPAVFVNGLSHGSLLSAAAAEAPTWLQYTTDAVAFVPARPKRVLLLENGPGGWAALAQHTGATRIQVVESNRALVDVLVGGDASLASEWRLSSVAIERASGRGFLRRTRGTFDLIRFPTVGALGGSAGLASASEQFFLTREAFIEAWQRLDPRGMIAVTAWMDFPERNPLRLLATLAEAVELMGGSPRAHVVAVRGWATITFLVRREPWTPRDAVDLRTFCAERGFDPLLLPGLTSDERQQHHAWQNPGFFEVVDALVDSPRELVYRAYAFALEPPTDARPYFSQFVRWTHTQRLREIFGERSLPFFELGSLVVALTFAVLAILGLVFILLPLVRMGWAAPGKAGVLLYFGGLGAGFMFVEIGLMLRAQATLGGPVLAAAVVITALLLASGAGSLWSGRLDGDSRMQRRVLGAIIAAVAGASAALAVLPGFAASWPAAAQIGLLAAIVGAVGFPLGMAFPLGVRRLETTQPAHIPWAWAVNGCVSVATPAAAMLLAMNAGFTALFIAAGLAYLLALLATGLTGASATRQG